MKECDEPGCQNRVWSHKKCSRHQHKRTDEKYLSKKNEPKKVYSIKIKPKTDNTEQILMNGIIATRRHVSFISGLNIDIVDDTTTYDNCTHVLAKGQNKYPAFKLFDKNIVLLTKEEHHLFDNGTDLGRKKYANELLDSGIIVHWEKIFTLAEILKDEYKKGNYGK